MALTYAAGILAWQKPEEQWLWLSIGASTLAIIIMGLCVFAYRIWSAIEGDGAARMTPQKAVIFLLVPGVNIIWIFLVLWGFARDCNVYIKRHDIPVHTLPTWVFFFFLLCLYVAPFFLAWIVTIPIAVLLSIVIIWTSIDSINSINEHKRTITLSL